MIQNNSAMSTQGKVIELLEKAKRNASGCTCSEMYTSRKMSDPSCAACDFHEVMQCVDEALSALRGKQEAQGIGPYSMMLATDYHREAGFFGYYVMFNNERLWDLRYPREVAMRYMDALNSAYLAGKQEHTDTAWISVETLPELHVLVVLVNNDRRWSTPDDMVAHVHAVGWLNEVHGQKYWSIPGERGFDISAFTHYQLLPAPPQTPVEP